MILNYIHYSNPTGARDMIDKLATFALTQGWTVDLQTSVTWEDTGGSYYDWVGGGDNYFLQIRSLGYGNQDLTYRFFCDPISSSEDMLYISAIEPGNSAYAHTFENPYLQYDWNNAAGYMTWFNRVSLPHSTFPDVWFVGNDKFIAVMMKVASTYVISFAVGTIELISELQDRDDVQCYWGGFDCSTSGSVRLWSNALSNLSSWFCPFGDQLSNSSSFQNRFVWYRGSYRYGDSHFRMNARMGSAIEDIDPGSQTQNIHYGTYPDCCVFNDWTQKRVLIRPTVFLSNPNADGTFIAAGHLPVYFLMFSGLTVGEIIVFGTEEYICFPSFKTDNVYGMAFRVT